MENIVEKYKFAQEQQGLETIHHSPKMRNFQAHHVQVFFKPKKNGSLSPNFKIKTDSVTEKPIFDPFVVRENVKGG